MSIRVPNERGAEHCGQAAGETRIFFEVHGLVSRPEREGVTGRVQVARAGETVQLVGRKLGEDFVDCFVIGCGVFVVVLCRLF